MKNLITAAVALVLTGTASLASAHHSAVQFDFTKQVPISGTVKSFRAINPHMQLTLEVKNANGSGVHDVEIEGHSTNNMYRSGYRKGMVNAGDQITVNVAPQRDGKEGGYFVSATTAKGEFFGMRSSRLAQTQAVAEGKAAP